MKLYGKWKVTLPGEDYEWAPDDMTLGECLMVETETGLSFDDWLTAIAEDRAEACQVLVWFLRRKAGRQEERIAVDFPIRRLIFEQIAEPAADADPEASAASEAATPPSSPASTGSAPGSGTG